MVEDGAAAMDFLRKAPPYSQAALPDLILLDLNLPGKNGREVLAEIKSDPRLKRVPVIILTTSQAEEDILKAYHLHANGYIVKPVDLDQFFQTIKQLREFWFSIAVLPQNSH